MAIQKDLFMPQGDKGSWTGQITDPNNNNAPVDLTGKTVVFTMKSTPALTKSVTVTVPSTGTVQLGPFARADTIGIEPGPYQYDIVVIDGSGEHLTAQYGTFYLTFHANP